jgi:dethiobiotin synthetase
MAARTALGGRLIVVSGTGTGIGKTYLCEALLTALRASGRRVAGLKPVETGLSEGGLSDAQRLDRASSFHVKQSEYRFAEPISPHLAAREEGKPIVIERILAEVASLRREIDVALVELAGGLFTPLSDATVNAHLARALQPDSLILVAADRLGALHETISTTLAAGGLSLPITDVVLMAPECPDSSTGRNAAELVRLNAVPWAISLPRAQLEELSLHAALQTLATRVEASS